MRDESRELLANGRKFLDARSPNGICHANVNKETIVKSKLLWRLILSACTAGALWMYCLAYTFAQPAPRVTPNPAPPVTPNPAPPITPNPAPPITPNPAPPVTPNPAPPVTPNPAPPVTPNPAPPITPNPAPPIVPNPALPIESPTPT